MPAGVSDPFNALITRSSRARRGRGRCTGSGSLVKDLIDTAGIRTTYGSKIYADHVPARTAPAVGGCSRRGRCSSARRTCTSSPGASRARTRGTAPCSNPAQPGRTAGGSSGGNAAALAAGLCDIGLGTDTGCSFACRRPAAASSGSSRAGGASRLDGVFPLCPTFDTVGPMAPHGRGGGADVVGARRGAVPEPRARGADGRAAHAAAVGRRAGAAREPRRRAVRRAARGARRAGGRGRDPRAARRHLAALHLRGGRVAPRDVPGARRRVRRRTCARSSKQAQAVTPDEAAARPGVGRAAGAASGPPVDLYVAPVLGRDRCRRWTATSSTVRLELSAFLRPFNVLGWAALAIGDLQLAAPSDERVLAAGLAWERAEQL